MSANTPTPIPIIPAAPDLSWTAQLADAAAAFGVRLAVAGVLVLVLWLLAWLALRAANRAMRRTTAHANARLLVDRFIQFGFLLFGAGWVLSILGVQLTALVAVLGAISLAISLAMQDVLKNLVAGLIILVERPFAIGEHIDFKTFSGVVETIELRTTVLRTPTGQRVVIPNAMIFSEALVNRSAYGRQLVRFRVVIPLEPAGAVEPAEPIEAPELKEPAGERLAAEVLRAVLLAGPDPDAGQPASHPAAGHPAGPPGAPPFPGAPPAAVLVESLTAEKVTLRVEAWTGDARAAIPRLAWSLRRRLPGAEITVLE